MHVLPRTPIVLATMFSLGIASGAAADASIEDAPTEDEATASEAATYPLEIGAVRPSQSCGGEWEVTQLPTEDGRTLVAFLGTSEEWEISIKPDGITASLTSNCTLTLDVKPAEGVSYALTKISYEGHTTLDEGVFAQQSASYNFVGGPASARVSQGWTGPLEGPAALDVPFPTEGLAWSSCEAPSALQLRTSLYLRNTDPQRSGTLGLSLAPGTVMLVLEFATRPCAPTDG